MSNTPERAENGDHLWVWQEGDWVKRDYLKPYIFGKQSIIVIGGKTGVSASRYRSPADVRKFIQSHGRSTNCKDIDFGYVFDYFLECHGNSTATVFHFSCPDVRESLDELQKSMYRVGKAHSLSSGEIAQRVQKLVADPVFGFVDILFYLDDTTPPIAEDLPLKVYVDYAFGRIKRSAEVLATTIEEAAACMKPGSRIYLVIGPLWRLALNGLDGWADPVLFTDTRLQLSPDWIKRIEHATRTEIYCDGSHLKKFPSFPKTELRSYLNRESSWSCQKQRGYRMAYKFVREIMHRRHMYNFNRLDNLMTQTHVSSDTWRQNRRSSLPNWLPRKRKLSRKRFLQDYRRPRAGGSQNENSVTKSHEDILEPIQDHARVVSQNGDEKCAAIVSECALANCVALILHSGRHDGVTQACCWELARLGSKVAVLFSYTDSTTATGIKEVISLVERSGGKAVAIAGLPFWTVANVPGKSKLLFHGKAIQRALEALNSHSFDIIVNNAGRRLPFAMLELLGNYKEAVRRQRWDSLDNASILHSVLNHSLEPGWLSPQSRVVNIATCFADYPLDHDALSLIENWVQPPKGPDNSKGISLRFNTVVPGNVYVGEQDAKDFQYEVPQEDPTLDPLCSMRALWDTAETVQETAVIVANLARPDCELQGYAIVGDDEKTADCNTLGCASSNSEHNLASASA